MKLKETFFFVVTAYILNACDAPLPKCSSQVNTIPSLGLLEPTKINFGLADTTFVEVNAVLADHCNTCHSTSVASGGIITDTEIEFKKNLADNKTHIADGHKNTNVPKASQDLVLGYIALLENPPQNTAPEKGSFAGAESVLKVHCQSCHGGAAPSADVALVTESDLKIHKDVITPYLSDGHKGTNLTQDEQDFVTSYLTTISSGTDNNGNSNDSGNSGNDTTDQQKENFANVLDIMNENCNSCHSTTAKSGGVILDTKVEFDKNAEKAYVNSGNGHYDAKMSAADLETVKLYVDSLKKPNNSDDALPGQQPTGDGSVDVCSVNAAPTNPDNSEDATVESFGKDLDPEVKKILYPQAFVDCYNQGLAFDRRTNKCHESKLTLRYNCGWSGVKSRFAAVQGASEEIEILEKAGWQVDQCAEKNGGVPVVFVIKFDESTTEVDFKVKVITTEAVE